MARQSPGLTATRSASGGGGAAVWAVTFAAPAPPLYPETGSDGGGLGFSSGNPLPTLRLLEVDKLIMVFKGGDFQ